EVFAIIQNPNSDKHLRIRGFGDLLPGWGERALILFLFIQLQKLTKYLDPKNLGKISFRNFCHGVFAIKGCEELLNDGVCEPSVLLPPYQAEYEDYYYQVPTVRAPHTVH
uniref:EF-hand domain-containing protein n=1 Tax=Callorhinchus milii TaxID=7868 RepID=A0A4W3GEM9_CALMI